jgi:hypothetical protein
MFMTYQLHKVSFSCKYFVTAKSDKDPDTHGSTWVWPWIRRGKKLDWVPMWIHSTGFLFGKVKEQFGKGWQHSREDAAHREADLLAKFNALRNNFQKGG